MTQRIKSTALALVLLGSLAVYAFASVRLFRAHRAVSSNTIEGLETGVRLAPWNAEYSLLLARSRTLGLLDFPRGIQEYKRAMALNPYSSRGWLDLAAAYQMAGDSTGQSQAIERAVQVDPTTPSVAWEAASFYILQGKVDQALPHYRTVLKSQENEASSVLEILWPATAHNADLILAKALPPDAKIHADFLRFVADQKDLGAARKVWARLVDLKTAVDAQTAFPYIKLLLDSHEPAEAASTWNQLATLQPKMAEYLPQQDNLIINGDFENPLLGGGLEWSFVREADVDLKVDSLEFHGGNHSLAATFEPGPVSTLGFSQWVPVQGGAQYRFSVFVKSEDLTTASGPRLSITDAYTKERFFLSDDERGSTGWKEITAVFRVKPETSALKIEVIREPGQSLIKGKFYMDDFTLRRGE